MSCSLQDVKTDALNEAKRIFKGNARSVVFKNNTAVINYGNSYQVKTYNQAFRMAQQKLQSIEKWAVEKFGRNFRAGWGHIDATVKDQISVDIRIPNNLLQAYTVKKNRDLDYYNGDEQLMKQEEELLYQLESGEESPNAKIESTIKSWLSKVGITYNPTDKIYDIEGNEINAVAKADIFNKVIEVVEGKRDIYTLPEEAAHMLVRMLGTEHSLVKAMMNNVDKYQVYEDVINSPYGEMYKGNEPKLREEAVGKLISQIIVANETGENMPAKIEVNRWNQAWSWLVNRLKKLIGTTVKDDLAPFIAAKDIIIEGEEPMVSKEFKDSSYEPGTVFYQLNEEEVTNVINKLKGTGIYYNVEEKAYYTSAGEKVANRVTELVKAEDAKRFRRKGETEMTPASKLAADGGTVAHSYLNHITEYILTQTNNDLTKVGSVKIPKLTIANLVKEELMKHPEISQRGEEFLDINNGMFMELGVNVVNRLKHIQRTQDLINKETGVNGKVTVLPEFTIYKPSEDLAGTIDLLVIYSNGKASMYDYKGRKFYRRGEVVAEEFPLTKIRTGENQLAIYHRILREEFGIKEFNETRLIPLNIQFNKDSKLSTLEIGDDNFQREYLEEIPVVDEKTGIDVIDKQLDKMFITRRKMDAQLQKDYKNKDLRIKLDRLNKSIRKLQLEQDTRYLYLEVDALLKDFAQRLTRPEDLEKGINHTYLRELKDYLTTYNGFFSEAKKIELAKDIDEETAQKIKNKYNAIFVDIQDALTTISNKSVEILEKTHNIDFNKSVQEQNALGSMFKKLSQYSRGQFKALYNLVSRREHYVREHIQDIYKDLDDKRTKLNDWAKSKGLSLEQAMDKLINKKGSLVSKFNGTYSKEKKQAIENRDKQWFLDNTNIIEKDGKLTYSDEESLTKFEESKKRQEQILEANYPGTKYEQYKVTKMGEWESRHDITKNVDALFQQPYYIKPADIERFHSDEWIYMNQEGNEPLLDSYNALIEYNTEFAKVTGREIKPTFIAEIQTGLLESLSNWGLGTSVLKNNLSKAFKVREEDVLMGSRDAVTGEVLPNIPLLFTDQLSIELSKKELEQIELELQKQGLTEGEKDYLNELAKVTAQKQREKGILLKSKDLFSSALLFAEAAYTYQFSTEIEDEVKALRASLEDVDTDLTSTSGKKLRDKLTGRIAKIVKAPQSELEIFEKFIKLHIYGRKIQNKDYATEGGLSVNKTLHQAMRYTSLKALGGSWITAIGNSVGITSNTIMLASEGQYFTKSQVKNAVKMLMNRGEDNSKHKPLLAYFSPYAHNITYEMSKNLSVSKVRKHLNEELFYMLMKYPDKAVDSVVAMSILQQWGIDENGSVRKISDKVKPLMETLEIKDDKVGGITEEQYVIIRKLMTTASNKIKGSMSREDQNLAGVNIYTGLLMQFRNWMPGLITARFKGLTYEEEIDELDIGRFRVLFGEFTKKGLLPKLKTFGDLVLELGTFGAIDRFSKKADKEVANKYFQKFLEENPDLVGKITLDQYVELRVQKLKGIAAELRILFSLYGAVALMGTAVPDDEESPLANFFSKNGYRMTQRGLLEISFFFDPSSVTYIIKQPLPIWRNITDIQKTILNTVDEGRDLVMGEDYKGVFHWEKDPNDRTGKLYYTSKMVPARVATDLFDFFDTFDQYIK